MKKPSRTRRRAKKRGRSRLPLYVGLAVALLVGGYLLAVDQLVRSRFEGKRWDIPARVYARPLELYAGLAITPARLAAELTLAGYRRENPPTLAGSYFLDDDGMRLVSRPFDFGEGREPSRRLRLTFDRAGIRRVEEAGNPDKALVVRLDPMRIGSFHPLCFEDRVIVTGAEIPALLTDTLLAVEDRNFPRHLGLDPRAVFRALLANLRAGTIQQGGSTITQQLVKNLFLDNRRTLWRKLNEAVMAVLLEIHYSKSEILTAYVNEVFLGQDGNRAVHGFALAGHFYFRRGLADLSVGQIATLVGLVKGPSYYDPNRYPERCRARRELVLDIMVADKLISADQRQAAAREAITDPAGLGSGLNRFPAFLGLVKRQLLKEYREADLAGAGITILTGFDPLAQQQVEEVLAQEMPGLEKGDRRRRVLQAAVVMTSRDSGEILALAGDRQAGFPGFNRALDARRSVGSLLKPAVYLAALESGYSLASPLEDRGIKPLGRGRGAWQPENYDHREHGRVPLFLALARSYNLATVRLGTEIGIERVAATLKRLGAEGEIPTNPAMLLGAVEMTPLEVAQIYQTMADGGFATPLRAIRLVLDADGKPLQRYELETEQRFAPAPIFMLNSGLAQVVANGTGRALAAYLPAGTAAGKTGTSNETRDSWFAGFTGDRVAVVWVGRDDNAAMGLTGATGALPLWGRIMRATGARPLAALPPPGIGWEVVRPEAYDQERSEPWGAVRLPVAIEAGQDAGQGRLFDRFKDFFTW